MKAELRQVILVFCPRVFLSVAPTGTQKPYITFQRIGGDALEYMDNEAPEARNSLVQIDVWSKDPDEADALLEQIKTALRQVEGFTAQPTGEARDDYDHDMEVYGASQDFNVWY